MKEKIRSESLSIKDIVSLTEKQIEEQKEKVYKLHKER